MLQVVKKKNVILGFLFFFLLAGTGVLSSIIANRTSIQYEEARVIYGFFTIIAIVIIFLQICHWGVDGIFSPLTWTMFGFIYFFFLVPIINAEYFDVYSRFTLFFPLAAMVFVGMLSFTVGFYLAPNLRWRFIRNWLTTPVSGRKLFILIFIFWMGYIGLTYFVAFSGGFSFSQFITQNKYLLGNRDALSEKFGGGLAYYGFFIMQQLPVALVPPTAFCIFSRRLPKWISILIFPGFLLGIFVSINLGGRSVLAYVLGGGGVYAVLRNMELKSLMTWRNLKYGGIAAGVFVALLFLTTFQLQFRLQASNASLDNIIERVFQGTNNDLYYQQTDQNFTLYRVIVADSEGSLDYLWGESYALTFVAMIPRNVWPDKPGGTAMYAKLRGINPWNANNNISHGYIGELIYNFSSWAVMPGSFLFGLFAGIWWRIFKQYRSHSRMQILYSMSVVSFAFMVRGTFNAMFGGILYPMLLTMFVLTFSGIKSRPSVTVAQSVQES